MTTTVIIGGVAGGMSAATRLRRRDEDMEIIVLEASGHVSFANCGLPYHLSGTIPGREQLLLQTPESLKSRFNLDVRVNTRATAINAEAQTVTTSTCETIAYDNLILSPGAAPIQVPGALTLRNVEDLDAMKEAIDGKSSATIIGGGFIGLEVAENLRKRGMEVTVIEGGPQVMAPLDPEMAGIVAKRLEDNGVKVVTGTIVKDISELDSDVVIAAIGVRPATELAESAGLETNRGIVVDEMMRTSDPNIYAVGDAVEKRHANDGELTLVPLAQTANRHGRLVADVITGRATKAKQVLGTAVVGVFGLTVATVGWAEKTARAQGRNVRAIHLHPANHAGYYPGATTIHLKLVVDADTDAILGAQAIGEDGADKRIDVIATAMRGGLTASDLADLELAYAPQFGSAKDPINMAGFINDNIVTGAKTVQYHEVADYVADGWKLVDVRTPAEHTAGTIDGAVNIPVDEIRDRLDEFTGEKVLVFCQVGMRGHTAASLLRNKGVEVANVDGGYLTWSLAGGA